jgi:Flp pilus assembly pilin Flp
MQVEAYMTQAIERFWREEDGQDIVEYTLLIGVMVLGAAALMRPQQSSVSAIWGATSTNLRDAVTSATS